MQAGPAEIRNNTAARIQDFHAQFERRSHYGSRPFPEDLCGRRYVLVHIVLRHFRIIETAGHRRQEFHFRCDQFLSVQFRIPVSRGIKKPRKIRHESYRDYDYGRIRLLCQYFPVKQMGIRKIRI